GGSPGEGVRGGEGAAAPGLPGHRPGSVPGGGTPVRPTGDDLRGMGATRQIHDDVIDAVVRGDAVHGVHAPLAAFARQVRALGDEPVPAPSGELAALLGGSPRPRRALRAVGAPVPAGTADRSERNSMSDVS